MASFEYLLKDFIAKVIDATPLLDDKLSKAKWIDIDVPRILANRSGISTVGATLVHPTQGWHSAEQVNTRYQALFERTPFSAAQVEVVNKLWILRHSVAHNAGMVTHYDSTRIGDEMLADHAVDIDADFIKSTFDFLNPMAKSICGDCGRYLFRAYFQPLRSRGPDYMADKSTYIKLKFLMEYVEGRAKELPEVEESIYREDFTSFSEQQ